MKRLKIYTTIVLFTLTLCLFVSLSLAWLSGKKDIIPNLSFSAGSPDEYTVYKISCENDTTVPIIEESETVGTEGFSVSDLQFGKITNLSYLEHSNYIYYAIKVPKTDGGNINLGVSYGDVDSDSDHFNIYVPERDADGNIIFDGEGNMTALPFEDTDKLSSIAAIETDNESTFISFSYVVSESDPSVFTDITEVEALFEVTDTFDMDSIDANGNPEVINIDYDISAITNDYYFVYVKLEPNISLYKYFVDYLWDNMPFYLAYEIKVTLLVTA